MKKILFLLTLSVLAYACGSERDESNLTDTGSSSSYLVTPRAGTQAAKYCASIFNRTYAEPYPSGPMADCLFKIPPSLKIDPCTVNSKNCVDVTQVSYPVGSNANDVKKTEIDSLKMQASALRNDLNDLNSNHCAPSVSMTKTKSNIGFVSYNANQGAPLACSGVSASLEIVDLIEKDIETESIGQSGEMLSIAKDLAKAAADIILSISPVGRPKDIFEGLIGRSIIPPFDELDPTDRVIAIVGGLTTGGGTLRVFEKIAKQAKGFKHAAKTVAEANKILARVKENFPEFRKAIEFLKRSNMTPKDRKKTIDSFGVKSKIHVLEKDQKAYRYFLEGKSDPRGNWLTNTKVKDPVKELALPEEGNYSVTEWIIPKGTEVIEGPISSKFGRQGGGNQFFILDSGVLK